VLTGLGQGLFQSPNTRALMNAAPGHERGEASGLMIMGRGLGRGLSVAVAGAPSRSTRHPGQLHSGDTRNGFHSAQDRREVLFVIVCQLI
jgi:hypothetical protein